MHHLQGQQGQAPISYPVGQMAMPPPSAMGMPTVATLPAGHSMHQQMLPGTTTAHQGSVYSQQPGPGYAPPGQVAPAAVGYHAQGGYPLHMVGGGGGGGTVTYQPPQMAQQPGGVYMAAPSVEYQQYNVQGMCFAVLSYKSL